MYRFWKPLIHRLFEAATVKTIVAVGARDVDYITQMTEYASQREGLLHVIEPSPPFGEGSVEASFQPHCLLHRARSFEILPSLTGYDAVLLDGDPNWYTVFQQLQQIRQTHCEGGLAQFPLVLLHQTGWPYARRDSYDDPDSIPDVFRLPYERKGIVRGQSELAEVGGVKRFRLNATQEGGSNNGVLVAMEDFLEETGSEFALFTIPFLFGLSILVTRERLRMQPAARQFLIDATSEAGLAALKPQLGPEDECVSPERTPYAASLPQNSVAIQTGGAAEKLSIIVVVYNMRREAERSLLSLSAQYQHDITDSEYEVIVVDNGSREPLNETTIQRFGRNFRYHYVRDASPSPAAALNLGVKMATGTRIGLMVDGAHILTPGVLRYARLAFEAFPSPVVAVRYFFVGSETQNAAVQKGYDQVAEDALFRSIDWPADGYRLFEIGTMASKPRCGWFQPMSESNCLFMRRSLFGQLGGVDEKFDLPAGGLANCDLFERAVTAPDVTPIVLLGEGSFHQFHNGTTTNIPVRAAVRTLMVHGLQYHAIRGHYFTTPHILPQFLGHMPPGALTSFDMLRHQEWDDLYQEFFSKEKEIRRLVRVNEERLQLIDQLHAQCAAKDGVDADLIKEIARVRSAADERLALIGQLNERGQALEGSCSEKDAAMLALLEELQSIRAAADERLALIGQLSERDQALERSCSEKDAAMQALLNELQSVRAAADERLSLIGQLSERGQALERSCSEKDAAMQALLKELQSIRAAADERLALIERLHAVASELSEADANGQR